MSSKDNKITKLFGKKIKFERFRKSMSQEKLAELSNLSRRTISTIETGETACRL